MKTKGAKYLPVLFVLALLPALVMAQPEKPVRARGARGERQEKKDVPDEKTNEKPVRARGEGAGGAWWKDVRTQKQLGLSEKQVAAIDEKMGKIQEKARGIAPKLRTANSELDELFTKDEINVGAIRKKADQRGKLLTRMAKATLERRLAVAGVLEPKQREEAAQLLERQALAREQGRGGRPQAAPEAEGPKGPRPQAQRLRAAAAGRGPALGELWKRERVQKALELTEEQVKTLTEKVGEINKQSGEIQPNLAEARGNLADLFKAEGIDAKEIRKVGGEINELERSLDKLNIERRIIVAQTLKPEQRVKLAEMKRNMTQQRQEEQTRVRKRDAKEGTESGDKVRAKVRKGAGKENTRSSEE